MVIRIRRIKVVPIRMLRDICMATIMLWLTNPYQEFLGLWMIYGALWLTWIALAFVSDQRAFISMILSRYSLLVFSWPVFVALCAIFGWASFALYQFTVPMIMISAAYYLTGKKQSSIMFFVVAYILYMTLINVVSITQLIEMPRLARILANSNKAVTKAYASPFTANFEHVNSVVLLSLAFLFLLKSKAVGKKTKIAIIALLLINIYTLVLAQYAISLISLAVFMMIILFVMSEKKNKRIVRILFFVLLGAAVLLFLPAIIKLIILPFGDGIVKTRLQELAALLEMGQSMASTDIAKRIAVYWQSLATFFRNPVIGVGGAVFRANGLVGGHSIILDTFAYYGICGGAIFVLNVLSAKKNIIKRCLPKTALRYRIIFACFLCNCLLNLCYRDEILVAIYFVIPLLLRMLERKEETAIAVKR